MTLKIKPHAIEQEFGPFTFPGIRLPNDGLHIKDTDASHDLIITPGSNLSADRILTITTGDDAITLNLPVVIFAAVAPAPTYAGQIWIDTS